MAIPLPWETQVSRLTLGEVCHWPPDPDPPGWPGKKLWWTYPPYTEVTTSIPAHKVPFTLCP